jgi:hypothetical protein
MKRISGGRWFAAFCVSVLGVLGAQSQCSRVVDDVTAPTGSLVGSGGNDRCTRECDRVFRQAGKEEDQRFKRNVRDCKDDRRREGPDEVPCLQAEAERHLDAVQAIANAYLDCIAACGGFGSFDACIAFCEQEGSRQTKDEDKIHREILRACDGNDDAAEPGGRVGEDPTGGRSSAGNPCHDGENARHEAALARIDTWVAACASRCHDQGGGGGGQ